MWTLVSVMLIASQTVALDGPRLREKSGPVLVEIGGWQVFASEVSGHGTHLRFEGVEASRGPGGPWTLVADSLIVGLKAPDLAEADWMLASGRVRVSGPDDLYVMARQMTTFEPARGLVFTGGDEPARFFGADWQLTAARIDVDLSSARVQLDALAQ
jgi:hypothetical protein